jgi:uncharacterized membrane protein YhhN
LKLKDFAKIYFVILLLHLVAIDVGDDVNLIYLSKPLLLFSLIAFFLSHTPKRSRAEKLFLGGLIFSLIGDVLLMFTEKAELYFMLGLGAFLLAQVNYILAFLNDARGKGGLVKAKPWLALPVLLYGAWFVYKLYPGLGHLLLPVVVYAAVLMFMLIAAINRGGAVLPRSASLLIIGALFFVLSDSALAYAKFVDAFSYNRLLVMSTYGVAQFFLVWGFLFPKLEK